MDLELKISTKFVQGTDLYVYRYLLKVGKPVGIRELQRALQLSSPSVAQYHLVKLERAGLIRKEQGNYVVHKVTLENFIKIRCFLVPKNLFYSFFAAVILIFDLAFLSQENLAVYLMVTTAASIFLIVLCRETLNVWRKGAVEYWLRPTHATDFI